MKPAILCFALLPLTLQACSPNSPDAPVAAASQTASDANPLKAMLSETCSPPDAAANASQPATAASSTTEHDGHASASDRASANVSESANSTATVPSAELWLDVRTPEEFATGHLKAAQNVPHSDIASRIAQIAPNKNQTIHLYCQSGRRAEIALQTLRDLGYTNVRNHGGYSALRQQGLE